MWSEEDKIVKVVGATLSEGFLVIFKFLLIVCHGSVANHQLLSYGMFRIHLLFR